MHFSKTKGVQNTFNSFKYYAWTGIVFIIICHSGIHLRVSQLHHSKSDEEYGMECFEFVSDILVDL